MIKLNFKEFWDDHSTPDAGDIWSSKSNADLAFGATNAASKYVMSNISTGRTKIDPAKLYIHKPRKKKKKT